MSYRSEMRVPIHKTQSCSLEFPTSPISSHYISSPSINQWSDSISIKGQGLSNNSTNNLQDKLAESIRLSSQAHGIDESEFDQLHSIDYFQQLYSHIGSQNGQLHFKAAFDVRKLNPDHIKVYVKDSFVILATDHVDASGPRSSSLRTTREYSRKFNLPPNIDLSTISCTVSDDEILIFDAEITQKQIDKRYTSSEIDHLADPPESPYGHHMSVQHKYNLTVDLGPDYLPEDISIKTREHKLFIGARHYDQQSASRTNYREFSKQVSLPHDVDALSLSASFCNGQLVIEAPYSHN